MSTAEAPTVAVPKPKARARRRKSRREGQSPWIWVAVVAIIIFCLFPFYWLINVSLKTGADLSSSSLVPPNPTLKNYSSIFKNDDFTNGLKNSAIVAFSVTILALLVGSFAAYALARLKLRGKFVILGIVLSVTTFPQIAIAAPLFKLWTDGITIFGWHIVLYNTRIGLIIPYLTFALPLAIYTLVAFFREIPWDLEQAAQVDGATPFQAFRKVIVPLAAPGVFTAAILVFIFCWNDFVFAISLTSSDASRTVPAALAFFTGDSQFTEPTGNIAAAASLVTVPIIIFVLIFQRRIVAGLTAGAVKG